jgi:hypothetical protein
MFRVPFHATRNLREDSLADDFRSARDSHSAPPPMCSAFAQGRLSLPLKSGYAHVDTVQKTVRI